MIGEPFDLKPFQNAAPDISVTTFGDGQSAADPKPGQPDPVTSTPKTKAARSKGSR
jgi:hypothetical protein